MDSALAYGRRKMGLPVDFERGNVASFDDGGVVPDPSAAPPQPEATDPESVLKYLSGDGALSPDVIMAMEAMADPDNTMDPTERMDAVLGKAPSPDVAFGVLQHHRTKYNGYTAAARVAAQKGDYAKAASYANKAHASVPGSRRRFAPGMGGIQMVDAQPTPTQSPQPEAPAFGQGGTVDSSNPNDEDSYASGGPVEGEDTRYDNMPESENIEDRRGERGEGWVPKGSGPSPESVGSAELSAYDQYSASQKKGAERLDQERNSGVVRKQQSFDYGGEVDEDPDVTAAVTPDDGAGGAGVSDDDLTTGGIKTTNTNNGAGYTSWSDPPTINAAGNRTWREHMVAQPGPNSAIRTLDPAEFTRRYGGPPQDDDDMTTGATMPEPAVPTSVPPSASALSPEDFNRMMVVPWDTSVQSARKNTVSPNDINAAIGWAGGKLWEGAKAVGGAAVDPRNWPTAPIGEGWSSPAPEWSTTGAPRPAGPQPTDQAEREMAGETTFGPQNTRTPVAPGEEDEARVSGYDPVSRPPPAGKRPDQMPQDESARAEKVRDPYREGRQHANERRDEMMEWYENQSRKLFPWASQEGQRQAFIMRGMERFFGQDLVRENALLADKAGVAQRKSQSDHDNLVYKTEHQDSRAEASQHTKLAIAAAHESGIAGRFGQSEFGKYIRTAMQTTPDALSDPAIMKQAQAALAQQGIRIQQGQERAAIELLLGNKPIAPRGPQPNDAAANGMGEAPGANHVAYLRAHARDPATRAAFARRYGEAALKQYAGD